MQNDNPITVYYNSACPVCDAGIRDQRARMASCAVTWVDVHRDTDGAARAGAELDTIRRSLHVRDAAGKMHVGSAALGELLRHTPRWRRAGALMQRADFLLAPLYNALASGLYRWNRRRGHW